MALLQLIQEAREEIRNPTSEEGTDENTDFINKAILEYLESLSKLARQIQLELDNDPTTDFYIPEFRMSRKMVQLVIATLHHRTTIGFTFQYQPNRRLELLLLSPVSLRSIQSLSLSDSPASVQSNIQAVFLNAIAETVETLLALHREELTDN